MIVRHQALTLEEGGDHLLWSGSNPRPTPRGSVQGPPAGSWVLNQSWRWFADSGAFDEVTVVEQRRAVHDRELLDEVDLAGTHRGHGGAGTEALQRDGVELRGAAHQFGFAEDGLEGVGIEAVGIHAPVPRDGVGRRAIGVVSQGDERLRVEDRHEDRQVAVRLVEVDDGGVVVGGVDAPR